MFFSLPKVLEIEDVSLPIMLEGIRFILKGCDCSDGMGGI